MIPFRSENYLGIISGSTEKTLGIISGSGSFHGQFGDHFGIGDHFGGCTDSRLKLATTFSIVSFDSVNSQSHASSRDGKR